MTQDQPKRRTQRERRARSERQIIRAAADLFAEQGFLRTTLNQIGSAAGYTGGLVSHRFGSKEGLLQAVVEQMGSRFRDEQLNEALHAARAVESLERLIEVYLNEVVVREKRIRTLYVVVGAALAAVPEIRDGVKALNEAAREMLVNLIERGQQESVFRKDVDAKDAACAALGILRGVVMQYLADSDAVDLSAQSPLIKDMVIRGLS
ncbi:MAG: TetR family transcriptional regulator [Gammaproteobacteria bacterium]|nr:TetR family transcriptional regulator [Gammaproteobacteria bacterium]MCY4198629.1 TetR family transcriptional regulator [Gammaproteobacteria bacterium]MCY4324347.1 TetR family transcriptional regulator [Gammaproteobacteria bacterium]